MNLIFALAFLFLWHEIYRIRKAVNSFYREWWEITQHRYNLEDEG